MSYTNINSYNSISSPLQIPGCTLWLDSADTSTILLSNTSNVYQWNDKSGNNFNVSAIGSSNPRYIDTVSGINFGSNQFLVNRSTSLNYQVHTLFLVCNQTVAGPTNTDSSRVLTFVNPGNNFDYLIGGITYGCIFRQSLNNYGLSGFYNIEFGTATGQLVPKAIYSETYNQRTDRVISTFYNGSNRSNVGPINTANNIESNYSAIVVGAGTSGTSTYTGYWIGNIFEIIVYTSVLNTTQRQYIEGYLASKWTLNTSLININPYRILAPNNYYNFAIDYVSVPQTQFQEFSNVPTQIPGLALWLDAADSNTIQFFPGTTNVSNWLDKSGNSRNATACNINMEYINTINNNRVITTPLNATNCNGFQTPSFILSPTNSTSCFIVFNQVTFTGPVSAEALYLTNNILNTHLQMVSRYNGTGMGFFTRINGATGGTFTACNIFNTPRIYELLYAPTTATAYVNGTPSFPYTATGSIITTSLTLRFFAQWSQGHACEVLLYNNALSPPQRQQVEGYLAWKWGINSNLPITHSYYTELYNNIFPNLSVNLPSVGPTVSYLTQGFSPLSIPGLGLWLDASDSSSLQRTGNVITQWNDKSGLNIIAQPSNSPTIVSNFLNNLNVIQFNSNSQQFFNCGSNIMNITTQNFAIFALVNILNTQISAIVSKGYTNSVTDRSYSLFTTFFQYRAATTVATTPFTMISNNWFIISGMGYRTGSFTPVYLNGLLAGSFNFTSTGAVGNNSNFFIGGSEIGSYYNGYIAEIICYSNIITPPQRQQVEGYLAWKWGLTGQLSSGHQNQYIPP